MILRRYARARHEENWGCPKTGRIAGGDLIIERYNFRDEVRPPMAVGWAHGDIPAAVRLARIDLIQLTRYGRVGIPE
jgi:hypothetical protein